MLIVSSALLIAVDSTPDRRIVPARAEDPHYDRRSMGRLCERPGCSEHAALAYGMRTEDLVFWIDVLRESTASAGGVLCQRHGDSMVVPRGWTLDDLRDPELHLFRPPRAERPVQRRRRRAHRDGDDETRQLELGGLGLDTPTSADASEVADTTAGVATAEHAMASTGEIAEAADPDEQWTPNFDDGDDLDGLLSARSPLLSRAFRGTDRPG